MFKSAAKSSTKFSSILQIQKFPSRYEIYKALEVFLSEKHYPISYESINKDKSISLVFYKPNLALEFAQVLQIKKNKFLLYKDIETKITVSLLKEEPIEREYKGINMTVPDSPRNRDFSTLNTSRREETKEEKYHQNSIRRVSTKPRNIRLVDGNLYSKLLPTGRSLNNSVPYIEKSKLDYLESLKDQEKWIKKDGFNTNTKRLNIERKSEIQNYVSVTPSSPVHMHQFRDELKEKFIGLRKSTKLIRPIKLKK